MKLPGITTSPLGWFVSIPYRVVALLAFVVFVPVAALALVFGDFKTKGDT